MVYDAIGSYTDAIDAKGFLVDYLNRRSEGVALQGRIVHPTASSTAKPQPSGVDKGFVQVSKKKRSTKKTAAERAVGSAVGVGGRTVVGANH